MSHKNGHNGHGTNGSEAALHVSAGQALRIGRIPWRSPSQTWGGNGSGKRCSVCEELVSPDEPEIELDFGGDEPLPGPFHLHVICFNAWEAVRAQFPNESKDKAPIPAAPDRGLKLSPGDARIRAREHAGCTGKRGLREP